MDQVSAIAKEGQAKSQKPGKPRFYQIRPMPALVGNSVGQRVAIAVDQSPQSLLPQRPVGTHSEDYIGRTDTYLQEMGNEGFPGKFDHLRARSKVEKGGPGNSQNP